MAISKKRYIAARIVGLLILLLLCGVVALQVPAVQTRIAKIAAAKLSESMDGEVSIGSVRILPFNTLIVKDVSIIDSSPSIPGTDTLGRIGHLSATFSLKSLFRKSGFDLNRVEIKDVLFQLVSPPEGGDVNITRVFRLKSNPDAQMTLDSLFTIHKLSVKNARYTMHLPATSTTVQQHGMNYADMDIVCNVEAHDVGFSGGRCRAVVDHLDAKEKSGFEIYEASGSCLVGQGKTIINSFKLRDNGGSDMNLRHVIFSYDDTYAWSDFLNKVELDVDIAPSRLVLSSISGYGNGVFYGNEFTADISSGRFKGPVSNFRISDFVFTTPDKGASGTINGTCKGIPDTQNMRIDATLDDVRFSTKGLEAALNKLGVKAKLPANMAKGAEFTLNGSISGLLNDFKGNFDINSSLGKVNASASARNLIDPSKDGTVAAVVNTSSLDLGKLLGNSSLGPCDLDAKLNASMGKKGIKADVEGINISRLNFMGYDYSGLGLDATFDGRNIVASLSSDDPNALLNLDASLDTKNQSGRIIGTLTNVDLAALNIDTRGGASKVSCSVYADQGVEANAPMHIQIGDLILSNNDGDHYIGDIDAEARTGDSLLTLILNSNCLDVKYTGTTDLKGLVRDVKLATVERSFPDYFATGAESGGLQATVSAVFHDADPLLTFIMPGLTIANGTTANVDLDSDGRLLGYVDSPQIALGGIGVSDLNLAIDNQFDNLDLSLNAGSLKFNGMTFDKAQLSAQAADDRASLTLLYEGADVLEKGSELNLEAGLHKGESGKPEIDIQTLPSYLRVKDDVWELARSSLLLHDGGIDAVGFKLFSDSQSISINGKISPDSHEQMQMVLDKLDLSIINDFMPEGGLNIQGILDGYATVISPLPSELGISANLSLDDLQLWGRQAGNIRLLSEWDDDEKLINFRLMNTKGEDQMLRVLGNYALNNKKLVATVGMDGFDAGLIAPLVKSALSELDGKLYGSVKASGPINKLSLESEGIRLVDLRTRVAYTNVAYTLNGTVGLDNSGVKFNGIGVKDDYGGLGVVNGSLGFRNFKDFRLNTDLEMHKLKAIDIPVKGSSALYGDLAVSGKASVKGPFEALRIDADIVTAGVGNVNVPIPSSSAAAGSNLLTFVERDNGQDDSSPAPKSDYVKPSGKITIHAKMGISPEVTANVEIDKESGHVLTTGGNGSVVFDLDTSKDKLQLKGDYILDRGKYLFNLPGIVSKEFDIKDGSSLKFNGDIMESTLNIEAVHNVKTSLATLAPADSTAISSRRTVECQLKIDGKLRNPEVSFGINVPDLEPNTKILVDAALSTNDKIQKQFVALLLFGTFLPEENAGVVNGTNMLFANVGEIVSGQLNNILQKLEIPLDFGFGYQQDNGGTDIFDVAVSTQLFNNRIVVNGSVGNRKYSTSTSAYGDVVGDLDIGYKVLKSGELILKLFSHSADEYTSSLDYSQRNGAGITYQKEFDNTWTFLRQLFMSKKRKAQEALIESEKKKQMKTIQITE